MKPILLLSALLLPIAHADITSLPPSEVMPEEVYTPAQLADQYLTRLEQAFAARATATDDAQKAAADEQIAKLMSHITANPDLKTEVQKLLSTPNDRMRHLKELMESHGLSLSPA